MIRSSTAVTGHTPLTGQMPLFPYIPGDVTIHVHSSQPINHESQISATGSRNLRFMVDWLTGMNMNCHIAGDIGK
jgi:hypothetical protein